MAVGRAAGRAGAGLVGIVAVALVLSGAPAAAVPTTPAATSSSPSADSAAQAKAAAAKKKAAAAKKADAAKKRAEAAAKAAAQALQDAHDAASLIAATAALVAAQADLIVATEALATAKDELAEAREADVKAQSDLNAAAFAEQRAIRDLTAVRGRILSHRTDLGRLARSTYQAGGSYGEWSLALAAQTPNELADKLATMQSVASAGNAMIARLQQDRADLSNTQAELTAAREEQEIAREQTRLAVADKSAKEMLTRVATERVGVVVKAREAALSATAKAADEDRARYQTMIVQSGALAQRIQQLASGTRSAQGTGVFDRPGRGVVTSPYGPRLHPILHYVKVHTGTDFAAADGIAYAADNGVVLLTEFNVAYGNMTVIDHGTLAGHHVTTLYAHQAAFGVSPGDRVSKGQPIGVIGDTGFATGPHLHFEVRIDGNPLDPGPFLVNAKLPPTPSDALRRAKNAG
jgi:murein DD-endopeptidase MepM/ murein hydrolase activator NlpD